ncbi:aminotransferase class V-fold PLP-dependent enzyme [Jeongeupia naejangsanensis]|uniref:Aminotransferase class V-fold PLP-dependent enzyme n=1 Tax=Jeongeupia naejangsanensis TaxID=613195 RepID=A0ABS2BLJ3_9NEIS|nr:aminotransferase class V-fold PLP-dependent enzyme [Jeongeupia naejangsanensis]MBM3116487.1 aminotransferase class V-fold PLP-dependent enzyme [Jeongeupia naejangsanensis]
MSNVDLAQPLPTEGNGFQSPPESSNPARDHEAQPLSSNQKRLWLIDRIDQGGAHYNALNVYRIDGGLDIARLRSALNQVLDGHPVLRTVYPAEADQVGPQAALLPARIEIAVTDLSDADVAQRQAAAARIRDEALARPFDLSRDLMVRAQVLVHGNDCHVLFLTVHAIAMDDVSLPLFNRLLSAHYAAGPVPASAVQHAEFARWQGRQTAQADAQLGYWQARLAALPQCHNLPLDHPRPSEPDWQGSAHVQQLDPALSTALHALARQRQVTPKALFHVAFSALLSRYSGETDIVVGAESDPRDRAGMGGLIGPVAGHVVLRADLSGNPCFDDLLAQSRQTLDDADAHQDTTLEQLVQALGTDRDPAYHPLFQIMLRHRGDAHRDLALAGLSVAPVAIDVCTARFDLTLEIDTAGGGTVLRWEYATALFKRATIARMAHSLQLILQAIARQPQLRLGELPLLDAAAEQALASPRAQPSVPVADCGAHQLFEAQARTQPDAVALHHGTARCTYGELDAAASRLAERLQAGALPAGSRVGVCIPHSFALVAAILAVWKAGCVYVPLDPAFPDQRLAGMVGDAGVRAVLATAEQASRFAGVDVLSVDAAEAFAPGKGRAGLPANGGDPAYIMYTSGSSGRPKGVLAQHRSLVNRLTWLERTWPAGRHEVFSLKTSLGFVDHIAELMQSLVCGAPLLIVDREQLFETGALIDLLKQHAVTRLTVVPSLLRALLDSGRLAELDLLELVISSGEALPGELARDFHQALPMARLVNLYGSTEIGADVSWHECVFNDDLDAVTRYFRDDAQPSTGVPVAHQPEPPVDARFDFSDTTIANAPISYDAYLRGLHQHVVPNTVNVVSSRYIGHMTSGLPSFLPELSALITSMNQNLVKIETSRVLTFLERQVVAQLHRLFFDLPADYYQQYVQDPHHVFGAVTSGGTVANLLALWCARNKALIGHDISKETLVRRGAHQTVQSLGYSGVAILGTRLMHYSMKKAVALFGLGEESLVHVAQDEAQRMSPAALEQQIAECRRANKLIIAIVGIAGATETGTVDPLPQIAEIAARENIHFHVDAAWGGAFQFSRKHKNLLAGVELADSVTFCAHKQLYMPQGISLCLFRDAASIHAISTHAAYQAKQGSFDFGQYTVEGSRPANVLYLHASLNVLSRQGYAWLVERNLARARYFADLVAGSECFELIGTPDMNIVNYRYLPRHLRDGYRPEDNAELNRLVVQIQEFQFHRDETFVSKTRLLVPHISPEPIDVFRVVLCNPLTQGEDLVAVLNDQIDIGRRFDPSPAGVFSRADELVEGDDGLRTVPAGQPIANTSLYVLDHYGQPVPTGVAGELHVAGAGVADGYVGLPELTAGSFVANPFDRAFGGRMYRTGDMARWLPDGQIELLGRADQQIKLNGCRIEPGEIEAVLKAHPQVSHAVVVAQPRGLIAWLVADAAEATLKPQLQAALQDQLPAYMRPGALHFVDSLPLLPNGKVDRRQLQQRKPTAEQGVFIAPQGEMETLLAGLWAELLTRDEVSADGRFFDLGGHSLLVVQLVTRLRQRGIELAPRDVFANLPLRELAARCKLGANDDTGAQAAITGKVPLLANHHWFLKRANYHHWNATQLCHIERDVDLGVLQRAMAAVLQHHDGLRVLWTQHDGRYQQHVLAFDAMPVWWQRIDLAGIAPADEAATIEQICDQLQRSLDIGRQMFKAVVFDFGPDRARRLFILAHHLIIDAYSFGIVLDDLETAYRQLARQQALQLPRKTASIRDWAQWQANYARSAALPQLDYWAGKDWSRCLPLPADGNQQALAVNFGLSVLEIRSALLTEQATAGLEVLAREAGVPVSSLLLASLAMTYKSQFKQSCYAVNTVHNGRIARHDARFELSRTVAWLSNYSIAHLDLATLPRGASRIDIARGIHAQLNELQDDGLSYSSLRYLSNDPAIVEIMKRVPEAQIEFNFVPRSIHLPKDDERILLEAPESTGSPDGLMHAGFTPFIKAEYQGDRLVIRWGYCKTRYHRDTVDALIHQQIQWLEALLVESRAEAEAVCAN